jgi:hypothetical protein
VIVHPSERISRRVARPFAGSPDADDDPDRRPPAGGFPLRIRRHRQPPLRCCSGGPFAAVRAIHRAPQFAPSEARPRRSRVPAFSAGLATAAALLLWIAMRAATIDGDYHAPRLRRARSSRRRRPSESSDDEVDRVRGDRRCADRMLGPGAPLDRARSGTRSSVPAWCSISSTRSSSTTSRSARWVISSTRGPSPSMSSGGRRDAGVVRRCLGGWNVSRADRDGRPRPRVVANAPLDPMDPPGCAIRGRCVRIDRRLP